MLTIETAKVFQPLLAPSVMPMRSLGEWSCKSGSVRQLGRPASSTRRDFLTERHT
jgi:hypothetical protein